MIADTTPAVITARSLQVWYRSIRALRDISVEIPQRKVTALIGASGSGKSTFLRSINRMLDTLPFARAEGEILFRGENILGDETDVVALRKAIGMVFQNPSPFPKSIYDNVAYGLEIQGMRNRRRGYVGPRKIVADEIEASDDPIDAAVARSLKEAALWEEVKDRLHLSAFQLSGGQQQRLSIARAIAVRPEVILFDEPCSQLDPISTHKIEELIMQLKEHYTIVIVTHNMHQARRISDYVGFFHLGEMVEFGPTARIFEHAEQQLTREYVRGEFG